MACWFGNAILFWWPHASYSTQSHNGTRQWAKSQEFDQVLSMCCSMTTSDPLALCMHFFLLKYYKNTAVSCQSSKVHVACRQGTNRTNARSATQNLVSSNILTRVSSAVAHSSNALPIVTQAPASQVIGCSHHHHYHCLLHQLSLVEIVTILYQTKTYTWRVALKERIFL